MEKVIRYILILIIALHLILGILWLAAGWGMVLCLFWMATSPSKALVRFRKISFLMYPTVIIGAVLAAITLKTLFFGIYTIPSGSMEKTIVPGDVIWVNNLSYGPRLPYSPYDISWINVLVWLWEGKDADTKKRWWHYKRLKGYSSPKRGDIAVFNHPNSDNVFIKRIVALPGDTLEIINGALFINGISQEAPLNALFFSKVMFRNSDDAHAILDSLNIKMFQINANHEQVFFNGSVSERELEALHQHPQVIHAAIDPCRPDTAWNVYPYCEYLDWDIDNYGPYILPNKGMAVKKTPENLWVYGALIKEESQCRPESERDNNGCFIFYNDYYFLMGDNRHDSEDSRYFGPVREDFLIGKASFLIFSKSKKHKAMSRIFSRIN